MAKAKKSIAKSAAQAKGLGDALVKLAATYAAGNAAVTSRTKDGKKFAATVKKLSKRKATLTKKKKTATNRVKKEANKDNKAALRGILKDLKTVGKDLTKAQAVKKANATEMGDLKVTQKRLTAYTKAIAQADKVLNKPKKKATPRKATKTNV